MQEVVENGITYIVDGQAKYVKVPEAPIRKISQAAFMDRFTQTELENAEESNNKTVRVFDKKAFAAPKCGELPKSRLVILHHSPQVKHKYKGITKTVATFHHQPSPGRHTAPHPISGQTVSPARYPAPRRGLSCKCNFSPLFSSLRIHR